MFYTTAIKSTEVPINTTTYQNILTHTVDLALKLALKSEEEGMILAAKQEDSIVGLLIGNVVKQTKNGNLFRSYRRMPKETEIDYLISLQLGTKGIGSTLVRDFLKKTDDFKTVVVRSDITEQARKFYLKMGFKFLNKDPNFFIQEQHDKRPMERVLTHWISLEKVAPMILKK